MIFDGDKLRLQREELGLSREEASALAGLCQKTIWKLENGRVERPRRSTLIKLQRNLKIKIRSLWTAKEEEL